MCNPKTNQNCRRKFSAFDYSMICLQIEVTCMEKLNCNFYNLARRVLPFIIISFPFLVIRSFSNKNKILQGFLPTFRMFLSQSFSVIYLLVLCRVYLFGLSLRFIKFSTQYLELSLNLHNMYREEISATLIFNAPVSYNI